MFLLVSGRHVGAHLDGKALDRKALDNIDLNLVSHRYVSGVLKDDHFVSARSRAPRF